MPVRFLLGGLLVTEAEPSLRARLEAAVLDGLAARLAPPVGAFFQAGERLLDLCQLPFDLFEDRHVTLAVEGLGAEVGRVLTRRGQSVESLALGLDRETVGDELVAQSFEPFPLRFQLRSRHLVLHAAIVSGDRPAVGSTYPESVAEHVAGRVHEYRAVCRWTGSTGSGYEEYGRAHEVEFAADGPRLEMSSDPAFRGDPALANPEQLLLAAAVSCQLLSFLAVAARARIDVIAYEDAAEAFMPEDDKPVRITTIELHPQITIGATKGHFQISRLEHLVQVAHGECFIANSLSSEVIVRPSFTFGAPDPGAGGGGGAQK